VAASHTLNTQQQQQQSMSADEPAEGPPTTECMSSSGEGWFVEVTPLPLDAARFTQMVTAPQCGAVAAFVGTTRDHFDGRRVVRLEYEAYGPMALRKMQVRESSGGQRDGGIWTRGALGKGKERKNGAPSSLERS
jgi:hypothetical protein